MLKNLFLAYFLSVYVYSCSAKSREYASPTCHPHYILSEVIKDIVKRLNLRHIDVIHSTKEGTELVIEKLHEEGVTTSFFTLNFSDSLIPPQHSGLYLPSKKVVLGMFDSITNYEALKELKKKSIFSVKTKLVLVGTEDLRKDIMDIVTEGDQLVLITEESQNRSNCGSFLIESLIWKNDGSATFTNAQDREIIFPPSQKNFGGRTFRATLLKKNNDRLAIKVLDVLSQVLNFSLTFPDPPADSYGTKDKAGEWGGAVGELARKERDVAAIQLSWTSERNAVIDFVEFYQLAALMFSTRAPRQFPRSGALFRLFGVEVINPNFSQ